MKFKCNSRKSVFNFLSITVLIGTLSTACLAEEITIRHAKTTGDPKEELVLSVLKLALSKDESDNQYLYEEYMEYTSEGRLVSFIHDDTLNVMWAGTQPEYEKNLHPIRIPILKGMLGHRIFLIRDGDQHRFDQVKSFADLQKIPLGQGRFWGDTAVLKHANMTVIDPVKYTSLFPMLEGGRFDFFPRAIHEPWGEIEKHRELNLMVEKNILLIYPFAMYFFVAKENQALARHIQTGFRNAINDGSFDELLFSNPEVKKTLRLANLKNRTVYRLENPNMTDETPVDDESLWLKIDELNG